MYIPKDNWMKYFEMLRKLFSRVFLFEKDNKQKSVSSHERSTKPEKQQSNLNTAIDQKLVSNNTEGLTIINNSMLKEYRVIIDHISEDNRTSINHDISQNDDEITILDQSEINKINNRISYNDQMIDDDKTCLYELKIKDQEDDITIISSDQFSNNVSKRSRR
jgi:uncharacterized transporter YbjL